MFNIMVRKRIKKEDEPEEDDKGKVKKEVKSKSLVRFAVLFFYCTFCLLYM